MDLNVMKIRLERHMSEQVDDWNQARSAHTVARELDMGEEVCTRFLKHEQDCLDILRQTMSEYDAIWQAYAAERGIQP